MRKDKFVSTLIGGALAAAGGVAGYTFLIRPWHLKWGATEEECCEPLPGDEILPTPDLEATHAITIQAPVSEVWPWLVQIGQNKGGFYSYTWLENLAGCDMHNADRVVPEWQSLRVGDVVWLHPKAPPLLVSILEPYRAIVLGGAGEIVEGNRSAAEMEGTWGMYLKEVDPKTTRLILRIRWIRERGVISWLSNYLVLEPAHFVMERKMLLNIKKRAENLSSQRARTEKVDAKKQVVSASR